MVGLQCKEKFGWTNSQRHVLGPGRPLEYLARTSRGGRSAIDAPRPAPHPSRPALERAGQSSSRRWQGVHKKHRQMQQSRLGSAPQESQCEEVVETFFRGGGRKKTRENSAQVRTCKREHSTEFPSSSLAAAVCPASRRTATARQIRGRRWEKDRKQTRLTSAEKRCKIRHHSCILRSARIVGRSVLKSRRCPR